MATAQTFALWRLRSLLDKIPSDRKSGNRVFLFCPFKSDGMFFAKDSLYLDKDCAAHDLPPMPVVSATAESKVFPHEVKPKGGVLDMCSVFHGTFTAELRTHSPSQPKHWCGFVNCDIPQKYLPYSNSSSKQLLNKYVNLFRVSTLACTCALRCVFAHWDTCRCLTLEWRYLCIIQLKLPPLVS